MLQLFTNGTVYTPRQRIQNGSVLIEDGRVIAVGGRSAMAVPPKAQVVDAGGRAICPGLIDLHVYGCHGAQLSKPQSFADELLWIAQNVATYGVRGFLISPPMSVSGNATEMRGILAALADAVEALALRRDPRAAVCLGIHLEGPGLDPEYKGAFPAETLIAPNLDDMRAWLTAAHGHIKLVTLAPNFSQSRAVAQLIRGHGILASIGHTSADYETADQALEPNGPFNIVTHMFNAMTPLRHREPGTAGAVLVSNVPAMLICDGLHVHPAAVKTLVRAKTTEQVILVTDGIAAAGMPDGGFKLFGRDVTVRHGLATLPDGTLAGSALTMNRAILNARDFAVLEFIDALRMASFNPAHALGQRLLGGILPGTEPNIILMDEMSGEVMAIEQ